MCKSKNTFNFASTNLAIQKYLSVTHSAIDFTGIFGESIVLAKLNTTKNKVVLRYFQSESNGLTC